MNNKIPVILIFDIGKTNKKMLLINEQYKIAYEETMQLKEVEDEDGFPCENIEALTNWIFTCADALLKGSRFEIKAINCTAYGASFVYLDKDLNVATPLYSYLKPLSATIQNQFYEHYGGEKHFSSITASPVLGSLNSGMQLYRLKYEKPKVFEIIKYALHLPQYLGFIFTGAPKAEKTSIGCHTNLWDFCHHRYHEWVYKENLIDKFPTIITSNSIAGYFRNTIPVGSGLHDSSSALIPYLNSFNEPFVLLSTGTWCITLNPFNHSMLQENELQQDCLCYLSHEGRPVKASRLFSGQEHEDQVKRLAEHFKKPLHYYKELSYDNRYSGEMETDNYYKHQEINKSDNTIRHSSFLLKNLDEFRNYSEAYHQLIAALVKEQVKSTRLVLERTAVKRIFVDGGFSKNQIYMHFLAKAFPEIEVYAASVPQATALGAALVFHSHWNSKPLPLDIIEMRLYSVAHNASI